MGLRRVVNCADHLALCGQRLVTQPIQALDLLVPLLAEARGLVAIGRIDRVALQRVPEQLDRRARVADEREPGLLRGVEVRDVDVDEPRTGVCECRLRGRREIRPASTDADHEVGLGGDAVGGEGPGHSDRPERRRMVVRKRALAGLRLAFRNPRLLDEAAQCSGGPGVDDPAAGDDQGTLSRPDALDSLGDRRRVRDGPRNVPDAPREKLLGKVVGLGLHVLRKRERHGARLSLVDEDPHRR